MADTYFKNFQQISYSNNTVVDITERVTLVKQAIDNPLLYYPTNIANDIRPDQLAYKQYQDPYTSWIIYLSNDIVDPYFEWYLNDSQLINFVKDKYGSMDSAMNKVAYYINNYIDQPNITTAGFNALTPRQQYYWDPVYAYNNTIAAYSRKKEDIKYSTNFIIAVEYSGNASSFVYNEIVDMHITPTSVGRAQFLQSNATHCIMQHCYGDFYEHDAVQVSDSSTMVGRESNTSVQIFQTYFLANTIPADVLNYYSPIYLYDIEVEKNEGNKIINILIPQYVPQFINNLKNLVSS